MVEIYTQPGCQPCAQNKKFLDKNGISYTAKDVTDPNIWPEFEAMGFRTVPVLKNGDDIWTGFNPQKLRELI